MITPEFGATRLEVGVEAEAADPLDELPDPSAPQAARPSVRRLHSRTL